MCGENRASLETRVLTMGSPPRVRGKLDVSMVLIGSVRITPACAGKTRLRADSRESVEDHPRVCGENSSPFRSLILCPGSPPRVRGKQLTINLMQLAIRITPACAGKTKITIRVLIIDWDHPRVCGEN